MPRAPERPDKGRAIAVDPAQQIDAIRRIFLLSPVMMCTFDWQGHYTMVNPHLQRALGYTEEELLGQHYLQFVHPDDVEATMVTDRILHESETTVWNYEVRMLCKGGGHRLQSWDVSSGPQERVFYGVGRDVTEARRAERELAERRDEVAHFLRLQTMGEMATEMAHELNQPLGAIANYAQGAMARLRRGNLSADDMHDVLERIHGQALRAGDMIQRVRTFARKANLAAEPCDLNELVRNAVNLLTGGGRTDARVQLVLDEALPTIDGDATQLEQVILNLVRNGIDAVAGHTDACLSVRTERHDGTELRLAVTDNGCGLPDAAADRVFEAFYTTKVTGLGLGLPISRSIVEAHGGKIWAEPSDGRGATFVVSFPLVATANDSD